MSCKAAQTIANTATPVGRINVVIRYALLMTRLRSIASCLLLFALASCGGVSDAPSTASVLQRGISSDPETLDQHRSRSIQAADVIRDLGEGLLGYSATGELIPAAAESWERTYPN